MGFEDALHEGPGGVILFVGALIELVGAPAGSGASSLLLLLEVGENVLLSDVLLAGRPCGPEARTFLALLRDGLEPPLAARRFHGLRLLGFDLLLLLLDGLCVLSEVRAVQCLEARQPNLDGGSELSILILRFEHGVHGVLEDTQVLEAGEFLTHIEQEGVQVPDVVVREREGLELSQVRE